MGTKGRFYYFASESPAVLDALEQKTKGLIRGTISSSSHLSQTIILQSLKSSEFVREKEEKFAVMERRAKKVKKS